MFSDAIIKKTGSNYSVTYGDDSSTYAEFFWDAIEDSEQSQIQGRPVYKNVEMIRIMFAGDNTKEIVRMVNKVTSGNSISDIDRFPRQWAMFQAQQEQVMDGTPLEHWPPLDKAMVMTLKAMKIHTVEQLAGLSDANLSFMGARQLRENAKAWLSEAESGSEVMALRNHIEKLERDNLALRNTLEAFTKTTTQKQVDSVVSEVAAPVEEAVVKPIATKMRGRPKKVDNGKNTSGIDEASGE